MKEQDVEAWWRSGDAGWEQVVRRFPPVSKAWLPAELERFGVMEDEVAQPIRPADYWDNFWR